MISSGRNCGSPPFVRLSVMMFLQFFVFGATMPIISLYLKNELGFSGLQIGLILGATAASSLVSPLVAASIADRHISAERLLSLTHFGGAIMLYMLYTQTSFVPVLICHLGYWLIIGPSTALTTAITFHHAPKAAKIFGGIRLWGTIGWIAAAWVFRYGFASQNNIADAGSLRGALQLGIISSLVISVFALSIPRGTPRSNGSIVLFPKDALRIVTTPQVLVFSLFAVLISMADRMYVFGGGPYLQSLGFEQRDIAPVLSIGQIPEIVGLASLGWLISRFGVKRMLLLGAFLEIARFTLFTLHATGMPLYIGISFHGLTYAFFFVTASIFIDTNCDRGTRSGVHQYFSFMVSGAATLAGNLIAGAVAGGTGTGRMDVAAHYWLLPLLLSIIGFLGVLFFFRERRKQPEVIRPGSTVSDY